MKILVIDDDRLFTEPLVWRLEREGHDVTYCQSVDEVLDGWFELTGRSLEALAHSGLSDAALGTLRRIAFERTPTRERLRERLADVLSRAEIDEYTTPIEKHAQHSALAPRPDLIILDLMMPRGTRYSKEETDGGRGTGMRLLGDILKRIDRVPVIVLTVRNDADVQMGLQKRHAEVVKKILTKPTTPSQVILVVEELFEGKDGG